MFCGLTKLSVDAKGRIAIPKAHRERLVNDGINTLVITADFAGCLLLYPEPVWAELVPQIMNLPNAHPMAREYQRIYLGYADEQGFDSTGRIMLSAELREYADIDRRVFLMGQGKKFELWSEANWTAKVAQIREDVKNMDPALIPESLQTLNL